MPEEHPDQTFPAPHESFRGYRQTKPAHLLKSVQQWSIKGLLLEAVSTLAFYAHRVIHRGDGKAYSADELEAKILAQAPETSFGGLGEDDAGKLAQYGPYGELNASNLFVVHDPQDPNNVFIGVDASGGAVNLTFRAGVALASSLGPITLSEPRTWVLPDMSGTLTVGSLGGNGSADDAKAAVYAADGSLTATSAIGAVDPNDNLIAAGLSLLGLTFNQASFALTISIPTVTANRTLFAPDLGGTIAVAPTYANDAAAASGGLALGDLYYTGTKFRVRTV